MKRLFTLAAVALLGLVACTKNDNPTTPANPTPNPDTSIHDARFIPNWHDNDTLYGLINDSAGQWTGQYDTLVTRTSGDTSKILYKGVSYYIWWNAMATSDTFKPFAQQYNNVAISTSKDTSGIISKSAFNIARPYQYKTSAGVINSQRQTMTIGQRTGTPFAAWNGMYESRRTY